MAAKKKKLTSLKGKQIGMKNAGQVKGGTRRVDFNAGHVTSVKFPK